MTPIRIPALFLVAAILTASPSAAQKSRPSSLQPAGGYLAPGDPVAKVGPRTITAAAYSKAFFDSDPTTRPRPDSSGRVTFLGTLVQRDVMGLLALQINAPLEFTQRADLRTYSNSVLRNVLFQRMVLDSITVTEQEVRKIYDQYKEDVRIEHIQVEQKQLAEHIREELVAKKITWKDAVQRYSNAADRDRNGDMGWRSRLAVGTGLGQNVFSLAVGEYSQVFADGEGYQVARVAERRPGKPPAFEPLRASLEDQIRNAKSAHRTRLIQERLLKDYDVHYDQENLKWAATQFRRPVTMGNEGGQTAINITTEVPEIAPADTGRRLASYRGGQVTMRTLLAAYEAIDPVLRPTLETPEMVQGNVDVIILEPRMLELALERGLDKDPMAVGAIEYRREGMMVERLFADSIESKVQVTDAMRRRYYKENLAGFITYPRIRFAAFVAHSAPAADTLRAQLLGGTNAEDLIRLDSLRNVTRGSIQERTENEHGPYGKVLFEEMRPGQVRVEGPDPKGDYIVLQLLSYDEGRQLSYEESRALLDDIIRHKEEERLFQEFIARHSKKFTIETHPELVMRIELRQT